MTAHATAMAAVMGATSVVVVLAFTATLRLLTIRRDHGWLVAATTATHVMTTHAAHWFIPMEPTAATAV